MKDLNKVKSNTINFVQDYLLTKFNWVKKENSGGVLVYKVGNTEDVEYIYTVDPSHQTDLYTHSGVLIECYSTRKRSLLNKLPISDSNSHGVFITTNGLNSVICYDTLVEGINITNIEKFMEVCMEDINFHVMSQMIMLKLENLN